MSYHPYMNMDWEQYRRPDGTIDLMHAWLSTGGDYDSAGARWLDALMQIPPGITSRQAAAIALMSAGMFSDIQNR